MLNDIIKVGNIIKATYNNNTLLVLIIKLYGKKETTGFFGKVIHSTLPWYSPANNWGRYNIMDGSGTYLKINECQDITLFSEPDEKMYKIQKTITIDTITKEEKITRTTNTNDTLNVYNHPDCNYLLCIVNDTCCGYSRNTHTDYRDNVKEAYEMAKRVEK